MKINDVDFNDNGEIIDTLTGKILKDTPEERVRQSFINILQSDYGYPKANILREVPIQCRNQSRYSSVYFKKGGS